VLDPSFCSESGFLRVKYVRRFYGLETIDGVKCQINHLTDQDLNGIVNCYLTWRDIVEYIPAKYVFSENKLYDFSNLPVSAKKWCEYYTKTHPGVPDPYRHGSYVCFEGEREEWRLMQCVKRGNKPYIDLVRKKFDPFLQKEPLQFFSTELNDNRKINRHTNLLYVTGTCNPSNFNGISNAWLRFGEHWNTFITNIRQQFGGCEYIRTWQSQKNGYPHFHALIWIPFDFSVVPWFTEKNRLEWRISTRQKLHKGDKYTVRQRIKNAWKAGHIDILACADIGKSFRDMLKYITRDLEGGESDLTNAMVWYFGKQSFSISKNFESSLWGTRDIELAEPTNDDLIYGDSSNSNSTLKRIEIYPIIKRSDYDFSWQSDLDNWKNVPDPPPNIVRDLEYFACSCVPSSVKKKELDDGSLIDVVVFKRNESGW